ncbi:hypothetical protein CVT24_004659 [Panaeolus cyanescens]|uniref:DUF6534 domain-containing protein n=1 Tax=Panaeolus cyanescens TaxID=181874 RepID=A0A409YSI3_9AGAR|nr:hypothetical protein CVT24_004659 [Panaeolus cyanescens]
MFTKPSSLGPNWSSRLGRCLEFSSLVSNSLTIWLIASSPRLMATLSELAIDMYSLSSRYHVGVYIERKLDIASPSNPKRPSFSASFDMNALDQGPSHVLDSTYGAMLIGVLFAAGFEGMLIVQAFNYYDNFPNDPLRLKLMVAFVCTLDTVHLILISKAAYTNLVTNWGFIPGLLNSPLELNLHLIFTALSVLVAQSFFLQRIWVFSRGSKLVMASLIIPALAPFLLDIHLTVLVVGNTSVLEYSEHTSEVIAMFVTGAFADMLIALATCYYLRREKSPFAKTQSVIAKAIQMVVGTGLATSFIAIASVIGYFAKSDSFYFISLHFQLGRTYTNALLATLNARQSMRQILHDTTKSAPIDLGLSSTTNRQGHSVGDSIHFARVGDSQHASSTTVSQIDGSDGVKATIEVVDKEKRVGFVSGGDAYQEKGVAM